MNGMLDGLGDAGYIAAVIGANLFVILYSSLAKFWKHVEGWHIFTFMMVIALLLDHGAFLLVFGRYPGSEWVRAALYPALGAVIFWRVIILLQVQIDKRIRMQLLGAAEDGPEPQVK